MLHRQSKAEATYFPRLESARQEYIDWCWDGPALERFILAFSHPYDGAKTFSREKVLRLFDARFEPGQSHAHPFLHGQVFRIADNTIHVACEGGQLVIRERDIESEMALRVGDRLSTPYQYLQSALDLRPIYGPGGLRK